MRLVGYLENKYITMHGNMNVKLLKISCSRMNLHASRCYELSRVFFQHSECRRRYRHCQLQFRRFFNIMSRNQFDCVRADQAPRSSSNTFMLTGHIRQESKRSNCWRVLHEYLEQMDRIQLACVHNNKGP